MEYLKVKNSDKSKVMKQLNEITNSGVLVDKVFDFIQENQEMLNEDEYLKIKKEFPEISPGSIGMMILKNKYSINIKKTTIVILAFFLDMEFFNGIVNLSLNLTEFQSNAIHKIKIEERCLLLDMISTKKRENKDFNYHNKECVQNNIECGFRDNYMCNRSSEVINGQLKDLLSKQIIKKKNGLFKPTF